MIQYFKFEQEEYSSQILSEDIMGEYNSVLRRYCNLTKNPIDVTDIIVSAGLE